MELHDFGYTHNGCEEDIFKYLSMGFVDNNDSYSFMLLFSDRI